MISQSKHIYIAPCVASKSDYKGESTQTHFILYTCDTQVTFSLATFCVSEFVKV